MIQRNQSDVNGTSARQRREPCEGLPLTAEDARRGRETFINNPANIPAAWLPQGEPSPFEEDEPKATFRLRLVRFHEGQVRVDRRDHNGLRILRDDERLDEKFLTSGYVADAIDQGAM